MSSPTQRTLALLRERGWTAHVVERWVPQARKRIDLWGLDILAVRLDAVARTAGIGILAIQATSDNGGNVSARVKKLHGLPTTERLREIGWRIEVWGWRKRKGRWICREVEVLAQPTPCSEADPGAARSTSGHPIASRPTDTARGAPQAR